MRGTFERPDSGIDYYGGVLLGASAVGNRALDPATATAALDVLDGLADDDYLQYVRRFLAAGAAQMGSQWRYADLVTALFAAAEVIGPSSYLEIGVRRGRSMAIVATRSPDCNIIGIDLWQEQYAGMDNPGPAHVERELRRLGFRGELELLSGDSHRILPDLFSKRPELTFDLVTVDGDHSTRGARRDLLDVLPRLRIGGVLVFDDIRHPAHPGLNDVWSATVVRERRYATWEFDEIGYGVAVAVRRW